VKQSLLAYDQTALIQRIGVTANCRRTGRSRSAYWARRRDHPRRCDPPYEFVGFPVSAKYDSTTSVLDPVNGLRASVSVAPFRSFGATAATYLLSQTSGSAYLDLSGDGRSVLAARGIVGQVSGRRRLRSTAGSAHVRWRQRHRARLPLPIGRASVS